RLTEQPLGLREIKLQFFMERHSRCHASDPFVCGGDGGIELEHPTIFFEGFRPALLIFERARSTQLPADHGSALLLLDLSQRLLHLGRIGPNLGGFLKSCTRCCMIGARKRAETARHCRCERIVGELCLDARYRGAGARGLPIERERLAIVLQRLPQAPLLLEALGTRKQLEDGIERVRAFQTGCGLRVVWRDSRRELEGATRISRATLLERRSTQLQLLTQHRASLLLERIEQWSNTLEPLDGSVILARLHVRIACGQLRFRALELPTGPGIRSSRAQHLQTLAQWPAQVFCLLLGPREGREIDLVTLLRLCRTCGRSWSRRHH